MSKGLQGKIAVAHEASNVIRGAKLFVRHAFMFLDE
jgi:hypothetical protein